MKSENKVKIKTSFYQATTGDYVGMEVVGSVVDPKNISELAVTLKSPKFKNLIESKI